MAPPLSRQRSARLHVSESRDFTAHLDQSGIHRSASTNSHTTRLSRRPPKGMPRATPSANTIAFAYMICGVGNDPSLWAEAPSPLQGKVSHMSGALNRFWLPEILGSNPKPEQDEGLAKSLHSAMRSCFPHDVEICTGERAPACVLHSFVIQQDSSHSIYGVSLRIWSMASHTRAQAIRKRWNTTKANINDNHDETYWIPYSLSFLSKYPLYDLLGDHLRAIWLQCNEAPSLGTKEVSNLLKMLAPNLNGLVRIKAHGYTLCYRFPEYSTGFTNFAMWPLFSCLSIHNIVSAVEAALSPTGRIIFTSQHPAILTSATETLLKLVRLYEWSGLYIPVVHVRYLKSLVQEPGPYILGISAESRSLYTAPADAITVDLDCNYVLNSHTLTLFTQAQRLKLIAKIYRAFSHDVVPSGVPQHLQSAYVHGKLVLSGQTFVPRGEIESIQDPKWWDRDAILTVMDQICKKAIHKTGIKAVFGESQKKPLIIKVPVKYPSELEHARNRQIRDAQYALQDLVSFRGCINTKLGDINKKGNMLSEELEGWRKQFLKFRAIVDRFSGEVRELNTKIEKHKLEISRLNKAIAQYKMDSAALVKHLASAENPGDGSSEKLVMQQELIGNLERQNRHNEISLKGLQDHSAKVIQQRDDALRVVLNLRDFIDSQTHQLKETVNPTKSDEVSGPGQAEQKLEGQESLDSQNDSPSTGLAIDGNPIIPISRGEDSQVVPAMHSGTEASSQDAPEQLANKNDSQATIVSAKDGHTRDRSLDLNFKFDFDFGFKTDDQSSLNRASAIRPTQGPSTMRSRPSSTIRSKSTSTIESRSSSTRRSRRTTRSSLATTVERDSSRCSKRTPSVLDSSSKVDTRESKHRSNLSGTSFFFE